MRLSKQLFWNQLYLKVVKSANTPHWPPSGQICNGSLVAGLRGRYYALCSVRTLYNIFL